MTYNICIHATGHLIDKVTKKNKRGMSTKSTIINEGGVDVFVEHSEPQGVFGKLRGYNIYFIVEGSSLESFEVENEYFTINIKNFHKLPKKMKFWGGDILRIHYDEDGLLVIFKGGTRTTYHLEKKDFSIFE